ncbi:DUF397 domain-containing protein [Spirillospora sp. NPDC052269]
MNVTWRKSSYSGGATDEQCVELGRFVQRVGIRDSKSPGNGHLSLTEVEFGGLVECIKEMPSEG